MIHAKIILVMQKVSEIIQKLCKHHAEIMQKNMHNYVYTMLNMQNYAKKNGWDSNQRTVLPVLQGQAASGLPVGWNCDI